MQNLNKAVIKLQYALAAAGRPVSINRRQFYSIVYKRLVTKYTLRVEPQQQGESRPILLETYSLAEVAQRLASLLQEDTNEE